VITPKHLERAAGAAIERPGIATPIIIAPWASMGLKRAFQP
jgi:hypothetical protein